VRSAVGVRTEQDDLLWPEALGHLTGEPPNNGPGNVGAAIAAGR
jgi:hypothetical protein